MNEAHVMATITNEGRRIAVSFSWVASYVFKRLAVLVSGNLLLLQTLE